MRIHVAVMGKYIKTLVYLEVSFPDAEEKEIPLSLNKH